MPIQPVFGRGSVPASRNPRLLLYGALLLVAASAFFLRSDPTILAFASPPEGAPTPRSRIAPRGGALVICGGGGVPEAVRDRFIELAGGARANLVIIPTANRLADNGNASAMLEPWRDKGVASVQTFHTRSREQANDPEFTRPLDEATGVWFGGGSQSLLTEAYLGTEVERKLDALLDRGGVIGGISAGAAVMTRVMITRGRTEPDVGEGFGFLPGAVVDQHFLKRNRMVRLMSVLAGHPDLIGLGIDERTALVVNIRDRLVNVMGDSYVVACVPGPEGRPARLEVLKPGDEVNLAELRELEDPSLAIAHAIDADSL